MITSRGLEEIKAIFLEDKFAVYLCWACYNSNVDNDEFKEYLRKNIDDTMLYGVDVCSELWEMGDDESRINWLDKHIKLLESYEIGRG